MKGTLSKLFGNDGLGCPCSECEEATFRFENETFETVVSRYLSCPER